ncbi:MAG: tyrosine-type recombinase/integrase [Candidatus Dadabacteria bacterium]|nr:tyrosine-type recombinase/integrase [Candidatus Dadabacteria bacterium]
MGTVFKRGDSWVIEYKDTSNKLRRKTIGKVGIVTKTMAREILYQNERQIKRKQLDMLDVVIPSFNGISSEYLHHQKEVKQIRSYSRTAQAVSHFSKLFGTRKLSEISASDIDSYKQRRLKGGIKLNTIVRDLVVIRHLFNYAYNRKKFFGRNPVSESGLPQINDKKERILTTVEQERLLNNSTPELSAIIRLALNTGMRRDEFLFLKWGWVNLQEGLITLPHTHTKSNKSRKVPINKVVRKILLEKKLQSDGNNNVFHVSDTMSGSRTWLQRTFRKACKQAGIEGLRIHDLKHTAITRMVEAGIPLIDISKIVGTSIKLIVDRYSHQKESLKKAVDILANYS